VLDVLRRNNWKNARMRMLGKFKQNVNGEARVVALLHLVKKH
jgi:hypothetical protein